MRRVGLLLAAAAAVLAAAASGQAAPPRYTAKVTNPYFPLLPGMRWEYRSEGQARPLRDVVEVTQRVERIGGVPCAVVTDRDYVDGRLGGDHHRLVHAGRARGGVVLRRGDEGAR